jgi:predicted ATPase
MKLARISLKNFRCYQEQTAFDINELTLLIGRNDAGKSAILDALNIFFEEAKIDAGDGSIQGDKKDIRIICEFDDLPEEIDVDAGFKTTLKDEYLLNENGQLEIHKVYDGTLKTPKLTGTFAYALHPSADDRGDLLTLTNNQLKDRAKILEINTGDIDLKINSLIRQCIWESTGDLNLSPTQIPLDKEAAGKIWGQLKKSLPSFALFKSDRSSTDQDAEAQDPMKTAIKEALKSQEAELEKISQHVKNEVQTIAEKTVSKIKEMDPTLASQLKPSFSAPNWAGIFKVSLTDDDDVPINKRGSGVRRLILLNFFRAKAEQAAIDKGLPSVIYAVEEPETSQHPRNQKLLMKAFYELSSNPDCQVMLSTHTPTLARMVPIDSIRYISVQDDGCRKIFCGTDDTCQLLARDLGILPDHDVKLFIGVEGINDINFLKGISRILNVGGEDTPDLNQLEDDGKIIFIPCGGTNLALWACRLGNLNRPEFHLFDRDVKPPEVSKNNPTVHEINIRDNCEAVLTQKKEIENYLHPLAIAAARPEVDINFGDFDDVPAMVAQAIHENSDSAVSWEELKDRTRSKKISRAKQWLNTNAVDAMTPDLLNESDPNGDVKGWFKMMSELMMGQ